MSCGDMAGFANPGLGLVTGTGLFGDGGKKKQKNPAGRLGSKGDKLLKAYEYLYPRTLDLVGETAAGYGDLYRREADKTRADELAGFEKYGPGYVAALDSADPLRAKTKGILLENLDEGLDPAMTREIQQGSRAAFSSRGLLNTPASAVDELFSLGYRGKQLEDANVQRAMEFSRGTDPFLAYAGRPSAPQGANVQSPNYSSFTDDLFSYDVNSEIMRNNNAQASKNRTASYINSGISAVGSIAGAASSFI